MSKELRSVQTYKNVNLSEIELFASHNLFNNKYSFIVDEDLKNLASFH